MQKTHPRTYVIAAFTALLSMIVVAWQIGYSTGLGTSASATQAQTFQDTKSIVGKITDITGTTITLQPLVAGQTARKVSTDSNTVFKRVVPKDQKAYQNEISAFNEKIKTAQASGTLPSPADFKDVPVSFTFTPMALADLSPGTTVTITATKNILQGQQVVAAQIVIIAPAPPPYVLPPAPSLR